MLFDEKGEIVKEALAKIQKFEDSENKKLIYASTIGSISKLISRDNSDYDLRGIFVDKKFNFLQKKDLHNEKLIRFRLFDKNNTCNCIALWEASAFLNFLYEPFIDNGYKYKLIKNVIWSFNSPYSYDPFGIQNSVLFFIKKIISLEKEYSYQLNEISNFIKTINDTFNERCLLEIIHGSLYIKWICQFRELPPLSIYALLNILNNEEKSCLEEIIANLKRCSYKNSVDKSLLIKKVKNFSEQIIIESNKNIFEKKFDIPNNLIRHEKLTHIIKKHLPE